MTISETNNSLENQFLIAMPRLQDPYFSNSVTYLWKHNAEGALGIVVNKPLRVSIADIFSELDIDCTIDEGPFRSKMVLAGGPVERDKGFVIHDSSKTWESSLVVTDDINISASREVLQDIAAGNGPRHFLVALGCAGWDAGQLERELSENAWLTTPATSSLIFSEDYQGKAVTAAAQLGINLTHLSPEAGHS